MSGTISFLIGLLSIALMVTIHETGHFIFAKLSGITVEVFAIGWGKTIKRWRSGTTEYRINLFPLGGYCRLKGSEDLRRSLDSGDEDFSHIEKGSLFAVSPLKRIPTYLGGSLFNILFALILFIPFFMIDYQTYIDPHRIVISSDFPTVFGMDTGANAAKRAGMQSGDVIIAIDGEAVDNFSEIQRLLATKDKNNETIFTIIRSGNRMEIPIIPDYDEARQKAVFGIATHIEPIVGAVVPLSPESMTDLAVGDVIVAVQGVLVNHTIGVMDVLLENPKEVTFSVRHSDGSNETITYTPQKDELGNNLYGFSFSRPMETVKGLSLIGAVSKTVQKTIQSIGDTIALIPSIFHADFSMGESIAGPLRISYVIGEMRNSGLRASLHLLSMVSISLAIANLLPIPGLDGGAILLSIIEVIRGKRVSPTWYARFQAIGLAFLLFLMVMVVASDVFFFLGSR